MLLWKSYVMTGEWNEILNKRKEERGWARGQGIEDRYLSLLGQVESRVTKEFFAIQVKW